MTGATQATPALLWARAVLLAVVMVAVSAAGHVSADGLLPGPVTMLLLVGAAAVLSAGFLSRQVGRLRMVVLLLAGQTGTHLLLTVTAGHQTAPGAGHAVHRAGPAFTPPSFDGTRTERVGSLFDQVDAMRAEPVAGGVGAPGAADWLGSTLGHLGGHLSSALSGGGAAMALAHLVAVVALGLWLAAGEQALWAVLTLSAARLQDLAGCACVLRALHAVHHVAQLLLDARRRGLVLRSVRRDAVPLPHLLHLVGAHRGPPALLAS